MTFASSAFCAETANTCSSGTRSSRGRIDDLPPDFVVDGGIGLQVVPQAVDLVQHHDAARRRGAVVAAGQMLRPHLEIGLGHAGVGGEDEQHRVRFGELVRREVGLDADRVEAGRVENDEALLAAAGAGN